MKITIIGAGNSGLAMAAHMAHNGYNTTLWNRSIENIEKLIITKTIKCEGFICGDIVIDRVTNDIKIALDDADYIFITTPANSHAELARLIALNLTKSAIILLNPGRTFGAFDFLQNFTEANSNLSIMLAEAQTIIYTCRKTNEDSVNIISVKQNVLLSTLDASQNEDFIKRLPEVLKPFFIPAKSIIETSLGNVGMILHCAPLLLNTGWTESKSNIYKYYYDGISPSISKLIENIDYERVQVSSLLGYKVESTLEWMRRTYSISGDNLYECIQNNVSYKFIDAPRSLNHRYIFEDVPCGLVPLESVGKFLGIQMTYTTLIIDLACILAGSDFRKTGRVIDKFMFSNIFRQIINMKGDV